MLIEFDPDLLLCSSAPRNDRWCGRGRPDHQARVRRPAPVARSMAQTTGPLGTTKASLCTSRERPGPDLPQSDLLGKGEGRPLSGVEVDHFEATLGEYESGVPRDTGEGLVARTRLTGDRARGDGRERRRRSTGRRGAGAERRTRGEDQAGCSHHQCHSDQGQPPPDPAGPVTCLSRRWMCRRSSRRRPERGLVFGTDGIWRLNRPLRVGPSPRVQRYGLGAVWARGSIVLG